MSRYWAASLLSAHRRYRAGRACQRHGDRHGILFLRVFAVGLGISLSRFPASMRCIRFDSLICSG